MIARFAQKALAATTLAAGPAAVSANAAGMGYTPADARMNRGVSWAVVTLAAVAYAVLTSIVLVGFYFVRKHQRRGQNRPQNPMIP